MALLNKAQQQHQQTASLTTNQLSTLTQSNSNPLLQLQQQQPQVPHTNHHLANTMPPSGLAGSVNQVVNAVLSNNHQVNHEPPLVQEFRSESQESKDDENFDYRITIGEIINHRYKVEKNLGKGSFGQVVRCYDAVENEHVALKIIKNKKPFHDQARIEIRLLELLNSHKSDARSYIGKLNFVLFLKSSVIKMVLT